MDAKCRDRFLVQSIAVTPDADFSNIGALVSSLRRFENGLVD